MKPTFLIEGCGLAPEQCHIAFYKETNQYTIADLSHKHVQQEDLVMKGTYVSAPTNLISDLEWLNLHEEENYKREFYLSYKQDEAPIKISFTQKDETIDSLRRWLKNSDHE